MAFTHKFEINLQDVGIINGDIDFENPNDGLKIVSMTEGMEIHIHMLENILHTLKRCKEVVGHCDLNSFEITKKV